MTSLSLLQVKFTVVRVHYMKQHIRKLKKGMKSFKDWDLLASVKPLTLTSFLRVAQNSRLDISPDLSQSSTCDGPVLFDLCIAHLKTRGTCNFCHGYILANLQNHIHAAQTKGSVRLSHPNSEVV